MNSCNVCDYVGNNCCSCDSCKVKICQQCAGLSTTEIRCLELKKRKLIFLCEACENGLKQIPVLINKINELQDKVNNIQENTNVPLDIASNEKIIAELCERQRRANNVIMLNVKEPSGNNKQQRNEEDAKAVKEILNNISVDKENISIFRLGKYDANKTRPLKIKWNNPNDAITVLRNKRNIGTPGVIIFGDQTKMQRDYYLSVKSKLVELNSKGACKTIRYINNVPTIVDITNSKPKN